MKMPMTRHFLPIVRKAPLEPLSLDVISYPEQPHEMINQSQIAEGCGFDVFNSVFNEPYIRTKTTPQILSTTQESLSHDPLYLFRKSPPH